MGVVKGLDWSGLWACRTMEEGRSMGSRRHLGQASGLGFTQRAEATREGFEQGPAMIQSEG